MKASDLLVKALAIEGIEYVFGVPGEENADFMMSLEAVDDLRFILTRDEQGAAFMAEVYGRRTEDPALGPAPPGRPGPRRPPDPGAHPRPPTEEIKRGMEVLTRANRGRSMTLVLGVPQDSTPEMVELAKFAEGLAPDMMIAMPPKVGDSLEDYREYYSSLAKVTSRPIMIQTSPNRPGLEFKTDFILELADQYPNLGYVKEEVQPVFKRIQALVGQPQIKRVYSAMRGRYFAYDLRLGVDGLVSGMSMYAEVFAQMWAASREDDWDTVRDLHGRLLVMLTCETEIPGAGRYLLQRRGIFTTRTQRGRDYSLSQVQIDEIEHNLKGLEPYLIQVPSRA